MERVLVAAIVVIGLVVGLGIVVGNLQLIKTRNARASLAGGDAYRQLAEEYRRLSELAVTAQEHTDLKLSGISIRLDELREQLESVQRILKDVE